MADRELEKLARYLVHITGVHDFRALRHNVFPGGNYDAKQDLTLEITAIRETFEESGLLLAHSKKGASPSNAVLDEARHAIHSQKTAFNSFLQEHQLEPDTSALLPFTRWITPVGPPRYV
ncbi:nudix family protein [Salix suchowensis]|nr:nudix family protein [Salix suchowensis]